MPSFLHFFLHFFVDFGGFFWHFFILILHAFLTSLSPLQSTWGSNGGGADGGDATGTGGGGAGGGLSGEEEARQLRGMALLHAAVPIL